MDKLVVGAFAGVLIGIMVGLGAAHQAGDKLLPRYHSAIAECEQNLPRSQSCYAVIVAEPEGVE